MRVWLQGWFTWRALLFLLTAGLSVVSLGVGILVTAFGPWPAADIIAALTVAAGYALRAHRRAS